jgi:hypothetical protein
MRSLSPQVLQHSKFSNHIRTIFDDAKEVIASFDLERNYRPIKGGSIHIINELKVEEDLSSNEEGKNSYKFPRVGNITSS